MLFFRSEERLREWCSAGGHAPGPLVRMDQLWELAREWYSTRLQPGSRRPQPEEMRRIFARIGLAGAFWDPRSDVFGSETSGRSGGGRYRAVKRYASPYEATVAFREGERLRFERRESEWSGWIWCTADDGRQAWVPEAWAEMEESACLMKRDYTARELSVEPGDVVEVSLVESGWGWAAASSGKSGWVPLACLTRVQAGTA